MIETFAIANYRSLRDVVTPLSQLNVVTGANGSGKSNLYKALRLLAESASGSMINALAKEGGLDSAFWAGPESISRDMKAGRVAVQGGPRKNVVRLKLGFSGEDFGYCIALGLPTPSSSKFALDPEIKRECIWAGPYYRPAGCLVDRNGPLVKVRSGRSWEVYARHISSFESILNEIADPVATPEIFSIRQAIRGWRFYDHFRTDSESSIRVPQVGTRTPVLDHDGRELVAALQTIYEIGDSEALRLAIDDAFPGSRVEVEVDAGTRFSLRFYQPGLLRPLSQSELSDGTLRYLLLVAALLTPRPPSLLVLNEPETSLHPDLLPALARLIIKASAQTQVWVVSHANRLVSALNEYADCNAVQLNKALGETRITGQTRLDQPPWRWPE
ncbi:AAA family ATPase [Ketobacter sp. MCCC 1A13808]|uniref:AAA family ATPase n=1 Tax=Ketobacter sp. MCCC 1A13808 TaxID=2602738 RepID=UPI000F22B63A|nr:AAA family ATPase [Ketobacter sp. MCCC 1A13808]MVF13809.1 AAA family ATPase [Ketobacter sp. MCCC 1A13808]RLP54862.1 MAG: ATP-binding protein [Ketobacter sp.]